MKNDVVRWNAERNRNNKNNNNNNNISSSNNNNNNNKDARSPTTNKWHDDEQTTTTIRTSGTTRTICNDAFFVFGANKCDKNSRKEIKNRKIRFLVHKHSHNHSNNNNSKRLHAARTKLSRTFSQFLLTTVQISAVLLFLCSLNIGCASASKVDVPELTAAYELDYGNDGYSGRAKDDDDGHYTHTWAVHIPNGDHSELANEVAREHGFVNMGKIFDDHYHFAHHKVSKRSLTSASSHQSRLDVDQRVHWSQQQKAKSRRKRDFIRMRPSRTSSRALSLVDAVPFSDPKWAQMWYLNRGGGLDMNVIPAWKEGITGKGIVVTILDDGLESDHPDIEHNYDPKASYDVNNHDDDPMPRYDMTDSNRHGTRCAGEVAATANNSICAVGIAYGASVGGVRMLDGDVTDAVEARSLSLNPQHIDIYSASWGPDDDGKTVDGPGELASRAFIEGVTKGRQGKGSIFIWASGNGGREMDNCNCDGYTNSIWTLSISSATEDGHVPWYSEKCSSTLATTYSSGGQSEKQVVTTDLHHSCTVSHTGTSASAPIAAGIAALVLESNKNLTWRDLQHIVVRTAKPANLKDQSWSNNGVGRRISHSFGYGLMDAAAMVKVARSWKRVPEQQRCEINAPHVDKFIAPMGYITLQLTVKHCLSVNYLEHVQAKITLTSQRRGDIQLILKSPAGTKVTLLTPRIHDVSRSGFNQWPFMSVHTWGESPHGNWQLEIHNEGQYMAQITQWDLIFYGTEVPAQPSDPVRTNPGQFSPLGNELGHNDIEYDASGQWRNMQQVGESSVLSNDKTSTACLKSTIDQRCLVCATPTYLFQGRCYTFCPRQTYGKIVSATTHEIGSNMEPTSEEGNINMNGVADEELQAMDRKKRTIDIVPTESMRSCEFCDTSCLLCYGPLNSQCSTCFPGSQLHKEALTNETFCYVFTERSSGNSQDNKVATLLSPSTATTQSDATKHVQISARSVLLIVFSFFMLSSVLIIVVMMVNIRRNSGKWLPWRFHTGDSNLSASYTALLADTDLETADDAAFIAGVPKSTTTATTTHTKTKRKRDVAIKNVLAGLATSDESTSDSELE